MPTVAYTNAQQNSRNGTVHQWDSPMFKNTGVYASKVLMDRSLGAKKGGFPGITIGEIFTVQDVVNTYGLLYQWGRKDPFPTSADGTNNDTKTFFDGNGKALSIGIYPSKVSVETSIKSPMTFYATTPDWCTTASSVRWNSASNIYAPGQKTIYDPCPAGWKTPMMYQNSQEITSDNLQQNSIITNFGSVNDGSFVYNVKINSNQQFDKFLYYLRDKLVGYNLQADQNPKGGRLFLIGETKVSEATIHNSFWVGASPERNPGLNGGLSLAGRFAHFWCADYNSGGAFIGPFDTLIRIAFYQPSYAWDVRCIQE